MEDAELIRRLEVLEKKVNDTFISAEKTRKYLFWAGVISIALIVLPALGLVFAIPAFLSSFSDYGTLLQ